MSTLRATSSARCRSMATVKPQDTDSDYRRGNPRRSLFSAPCKTNFVSPVSFRGLLVSGPSCFSFSLHGWCTKGSVRFADIPVELWHMQMRAPFSAYAMCCARASWARRCQCAMSDTDLKVIRICCCSARCWPFLYRCARRVTSTLGTRASCPAQSNVEAYSLTIRPHDLSHLYTGDGSEPLLEHLHSCRVAEPRPGTCSYSPDGELGPHAHPASTRP